MAGLVGAQTGEGGDGLAEVQVLDGSAALGPDVAQTLSGGVDAVLVLHIDGGGADDGVAVDGGSNQNALAVLAGELEDGGVHMAAGGAVQQEIVAPAGNDGHGVVGDHVVDLVGIDAGGVDNDPGLKIALDGLDLPAAVDGHDAGDFRVKLELCAVGGGILGQGVVQAEGADDGAGGGVEGRHSLVGNVGLHLDQLFPLDDAQVADTVGNAVFVELHQVGTVILGKHDDQGAVALVMDVQILGKLLHHFAALDIELGHQGAVGRVEACVDDGGIGLGGAAADVLVPVDDEDIRLLAGQFTGNGAAGNTCADDDNIYQVTFTPLSNRGCANVGAPPARKNGQGGLGCMGDAVVTRE